MSRTIVIIFLLFVSSECNNSCCLPYTMDLASDARRIHTNLKEKVDRLHSVDDKITAYILEGYELFARNSDHDSVFQIVVFIFNDLKVYPLSDLYALLDFTPHHIALNAAIYRKVKDAFICVMNDFSATRGGGRKRSYDHVEKKA